MRKNLVLNFKNNLWYFFKNILHILWKFYAFHSQKWRDLTYDPHNFETVPCSLKYVETNAVVLSIETDGLRNYGYCGLGIQRSFDIFYTILNQYHVALINHRQGSRFLVITVAPLYNSMSTSIDQQWRRNNLKHEHSYEQRLYTYSVW